MMNQYFIKFILKMCRETLTKPNQSEDYYNGVVDLAVCEIEEIVTNKTRIEITKIIRSIDYNSNLNKLAFELEYI